MKNSKRSSFLLLYSTGILVKLLISTPLLFFFNILGFKCLVYIWWGILPCIILLVYNGLKGTYLEYKSHYFILVFITAVIIKYLFNILPLLTLGVPISSILYSYLINDMVISRSISCMAPRDFPFIFNPEDDPDAPNYTPRPVGPWGPIPWRNGRPISPYYSYHINTVAYHNIVFDPVSGETRVYYRGNGWSPTDRDQLSRWPIARPMHAFIRTGQEWPVIRFEGTNCAYCNGYIITYRDPDWDHNIRWLARTLTRDHAPKQTPNGYPIRHDL